MFTLFLHGKAVKNDQSLACENKLVINIKKTRITVISTFPFDPQLKEILAFSVNKYNNKITELRAILQRENQNS
jgi:hypothetical protein